MDQERVARHEAGHAVVALCRMQKYMTGVSLGSRQDAELISTAGRSQFIIQPESIDDLLAFEAADATVACAGGVGEFLTYRSFDRRGCLGDLLAFCRIVAIVVYESNRRIGRFLSGSELECAVKVRVQPILRQARSQATAVLLQEQRLFEAVTQSLLNEGELSRDQLLALHERFAVVR